LGRALSDAGKRAAAEAAAALVESGMRLGLGTGSTMMFVLDALAARIAADGIDVVGVPTSERTAARARELGIKLAELSDLPSLDLALDGADEVATGSLALIKGLGGALLREKIVVEAARRFVVVADDSKIVTRLGEHAPLPIEVVVFAHPVAARRLAALGLRPQLRTDGGAPYKTDNGNLIYDCRGVDAIDDMAALERSVVDIAGVVETGLFLGRAEQAIIGAGDGVRIMRRDD
jgi:ribose 5-phosphate isomerase A